VRTITDLLMLEEVQVPVALAHGVVYRVLPANLRQREPTTATEVDPKRQDPRHLIELRSGKEPRLPHSQRRREHLLAHPHHLHRSIRPA
jgi:hypothetical protein